MELRIEYPYIDEFGNEKIDKAKIFAEDENGNQYKVLKADTGEIANSFVDFYPSFGTYYPTALEIIEPPKFDLDEFNKIIEEEVKL